MSFKTTLSSVICVFSLRMKGDNLRRIGESLFIIYCPFFPESAALLTFMLQNVILAIVVLIIQAYE